MVLSAVSVIYIRTPESTAAASAGLSNTYEVAQGSANDSTATQLGNSVANGLVIVSVICAMTFVIVLLYKYRCMKCLIGYMIVSSGLLLGFLASQMFQVAIARYQLEIDKFSFYFTMYNFAIVGVVSIFATRVVPVYINQAYLIITSVIVAWELSNFDPWTAWVLLILLALYDLFAVLTPCGPLKALVNLMQREDAPNMPGLLYEASLPQQQHQRRNNNNSNNDSQNSTSHSSSINADDTRQSEPNADFSLQGQVPVAANSDERHSSHPRTETASICEGRQAATATETTHPQLQGPFVSVSNNGATAASLEAPVAFVDESVEEVSATEESSEGLAQNETEVESPVQEESVEVPADPLLIGRIPLAVAKVYKLPLLNGSQSQWVTNAEEQQEIGVYTPEQLRQEVDVVFPNRGGRIVPTVSLETEAVDLYRRTQGNEETRYTVIDYRGVHKRVIFVNQEGRIFEDLREQNAVEERKERTSIKLGLGDFIFYSILVSKAALYSYTTFAVCTLAILSGLGLTLLLLAVYGQALPALPISIFLGVVFYLFTRYVMEPWVKDIFVEQVYA